jgi:polyhydroxyalkanoate synthesis regulator phasin
VKISNRLLLVTAGGLAVVAASAITVSAFAASPSPSPSGPSQKATQYCQDFIGHLAGNLGKTQAQVFQALQQARNQTIDDAVKNGDLTQSQADKIKSALASKPQCALGRRGFGLPGLGTRGLAGVGTVVVDDTAKVLGISSDQLRQDLRGGQTLQQLASAKGMDTSTFQNKVADQVKTDLDPKVKSGDLTQSQEDRLVNSIRNGQLNLKHGPFGASRTRPPALPGTPSTPTP